MANGLGLQAADERRLAYMFLDHLQEAWQRWDAEAFGSAFSRDVDYAVHPHGPHLMGRQKVESYIRSRQASNRSLVVRLGVPIIEGLRVAVEYCASENRTTHAGCLLAELAESGECILFREYWFEIVDEDDVFGDWTAFTKTQSTASGEGRG